MKFILIGLGVLVFILGGVYGASTFGFLYIPGVSPYKFGKAVMASNDPKLGFFDTFAEPLASIVHEDQKAQAAVKKPPPLVSDKSSKPNPDLGDQKIADIWAAIDPAKLVGITAKWQPNDLARIMLKMDSGQVSEFIAVLPTDRAVKLSQAIQKLASIPPPTDQANS